MKAISTGSGAPSRAIRPAARIPYLTSGQRRCQDDSQCFPVSLQRLSAANWKPLTERDSARDRARIQQTLRMDYETFINASFFLQGKADQFTQQRPGDRKRILSSILGLEVWESYSQRAADGARHRRPRSQPGWALARDQRRAG